MVDYLGLAGELKPAAAMYTEGGVGDRLMRSLRTGDGSESRTSPVIGRDGRQYPAHQEPRRNGTAHPAGPFDKSRAGVQARLR